MSGWSGFGIRQNKLMSVIVLLVASARPHLTTIPYPLDLQNSPEGLRCAVTLFHNSTGGAGPCQPFQYLYPSVSKVKPSIPHSVEVYKANYTCFNLTGDGISVGYLPRGYCASYVDLSNNPANLTRSDFLEQTTGRADLWWLCGPKKLYASLPRNFSGQCALVQLVMPFKMFAPGDYSKLDAKLIQHSRSNRSMGNPGGSFDGGVYIDAIGVPRGVPDEFKARNQIGAGFESFLFWWSTIKKNVDWINYLYYNQQRFVNYTRDAVRGIAEQLGPTSLMAWQNRMALDMLLAEKGGVCKMFGTFCCTFIPNNTAPDGSITKALEGLTALSEELAENSGIDDPFTNWLQSMFGKYSSWIISVLMSFAVFAAVLVCCGCCCIPCLRSLVSRLIETALTKGEGHAPAVQMPLLNALHFDDIESDVEDDYLKVVFTP
ncbi:syncytin-A-like [Mastacembelus armatus]|uniref:syncytin-A-like n=1 Tax=Mastacembelus armatus TaxID=205130 RepID=UPI000E45D8D5|nr:syncytin-A-like [Mastacembelus armatus]XP_026185312.1 syncytin-A-like [Mastacembelus armatus]